jgi:hypothetical protein
MEIRAKARSPERTVLRRDRRALRLSGDERAYLFQVAALVPPEPGTVPAYITPSVQRLLDRLVGTPVGVYDAALTLLMADPLYAALMGDPSGLRGNERNGVWRNFLGPGSRVRHTPQDQRAFEAAWSPPARDRRPISRRSAPAAPGRTVANEQ